MALVPQVGRTPEMAAATAEPVYVRLLAAVREDTLVMAERKVLLALAVAVVVALLIARLAAAVVLAFTDKGPTARLVLAAGRVALEAEAAAGRVALKAATRDMRPAVVVVPFRSAVQVARLAEAVAGELTCRALALPELFASYGPATHGRSRLREQE